MANNADMLAALRLEQLDGSARELAETIGLEAFARLVERYGGTDKLYIPGAKTLTRPVRNELIRAEFDGGNYLQLARKWDLTERNVREIVKAKAQEIKRRPIDGQISLFESLGSDTDSTEK